MTSISITKADPRVRNAKSPISALRLLEFCSLLNRRAPFDRKNGTLLMGSDGSLGNVLSRTNARINEASAAQPAPCIEIQRPAPALVERPFLPFNSKPTQVFHGRISVVRFAPIGIEIFNSEDHNPSGLHSSFISLPESCRVAQMEMTSRRRSNPAAIGTRRRRSNIAVTP